MGIFLFYKTPFWATCSVLYPKDGFGTYFAHFSWDMNRATIICYFFSKFSSSFKIGLRSSSVSSTISVKAASTWSNPSMWKQRAKTIVDKRKNFPLKASNMNLKYQCLKSKLYSTLYSGSSNNGPLIDFIRTSLNNAEMKFTLKADIRQIFNRNLLFSLRLIIKQQFNNMLKNPTRAPEKTI